LAEDIFSDIDIPQHPLSAMDGYAVRSKDTSEGAVLDIVETILAGYLPKEEIAPYKCSKIMTGAILPKGADSVVMIEETEPLDGKIRVKRRVSPGENVRPKGEDMSAGERVIPKGERIRPADIGMMASLGKKDVWVIRRPKVGVLATGDEVVGIEERLEPGKIRNTNTYSLSAQIADAGAVPVDLGIARDDREDIRRKIERGLSCDAMVTTGGVSVGESDLVKEVAKEMGLSIIFYKVATKPGKPTLFGKIRGKLFFGLPGYPVSAMVCFEVFVRPAIMKMAGRSDVERRKREAVLSQEIKKKRGRVEYIRVKLKEEDGTLYATPTGPQRSARIASMVSADGLAVLERDATHFEAGSKVSVILLE
jgi:molybdopterin molybdotransferase